jgi:hypothetical protein
MKEVTIESALIRGTELQRLFEDALPLDSGIQLDLRERDAPDRSLDPTVLVAVVGAVGPVLAALVRGAVEAAKAKHAGRIVLRGRTGRSVEVPASTPIEQLDLYIRKAKQLDTESLEIC